MRALTEAEREERRDFLTDQAAVLFAERGYHGLTIDAVARGAGVAKGSVFLAFASKEDLVLHLVRRRFDAWFLRLSTVDPATGPRATAQAITQTLGADPLLLPLLALVGPVLEHGASPGAVVAFKQSLAAQLGQLSQRWSAHFPGVEAAKWRTLFLGVYALMIGVWSVGQSSEAVRSAVAGKPELEALLVGFDDLFPALLEAQLAAVTPN